jgi:hypothetical protein
MTAFACGQPISSGSSERPSTTSSIAKRGAGRGRLVRLLIREGVAEGFREPPSFLLGQQVRTGAGLEEAVQARVSTSRQKASTRAFHSSGTSWKG